MPKRDGVENPKEKDGPDEEDDWDWAAGVVIPKLGLGADGAAFALAKENESGFG